MAANLPDSFLSQTLFSSHVFILVVNLLDTQLKCPFNSANCHHACLMNKVFHRQNPLNSFFFFFERRWGRNRGEEEEIVPQVSEESKNTKPKQRPLLQLKNVTRALRGAWIYPVHQDMCHLSLTCWGLEFIPLSRLLENTQFETG